MNTSASPAPAPRVLRPWHFVLGFGIVSLLADMVFEGARSIIGPYLATLGASAAVVGLVAGAGEFIGYGLRVLSGYAMGRTHRYWTWAVIGYALTVLSVPLIGATGALAPALLLYGTERLGKAVRSPAKDTLLSHASARTGRGSAFGASQALGQTGAVLGPLLLAAVLGWREGDYRLAFAVLAVPGVLVLALLLWLRHRVPDPLAYEATAPPTAPPGTRPGPDAHPDAHPDVGTDLPAVLKDSHRLPARFWQYAATVALLSGGVVSFPLLAYHAHTTGLLTDAQVPVLFASAMLVNGAAGLVVGRVYDRRGPLTLLVVPIAAAASVLAFSHSVPGLWVGVAIWGVVNGVMDSTVKAVVTELVRPQTRAVAFGWLALVRGAGLLVAGAVLGVLYDRGVTYAVLVVLAANTAALLGLVAVLRSIAR